MKNLLNKAKKVLVVSLIAGQLLVGPSLAHAEEPPELLCDMFPSICGIKKPPLTDEQ